MLKDWIKDDRFTNGWRSKRNFNILIVYPSSLQNEDWVMEVNTRFGRGLVRRPFSTKSKTLAFARNYMRKN